MGEALSSQQIPRLNWCLYFIVVFLATQLYFKTHLQKFHKTTHNTHEDKYDNTCGSPRINTSGRWGHKSVGNSMDCFGGSSSPVRPRLEFLPCTGMSVWVTSTRLPLILNHVGRHFCIRSLANKWNTMMIVGFEIYMFWSLRCVNCFTLKQYLKKLSEPLKQYKHYTNHTHV